ncbi:MAG: Glu/Leu/Phe/Val dehydrogenase dimerization domain-containing protein [Bacteroidia bacterium]
MEELLKRFEHKAPEIVFEWKDAETEAEGWVVINSLRGGAAGGGTRMRKGLDRNEVESLAKTMEIKFSVSGPAIGGAKSGINFDPADPRKKGVLDRWYKAVMPLLKNYYGTGGDLNVDEIHEVIPITEAYGLWHPQEGVVNGHFNAPEGDKIRRVGQLRLGVSKVVEDPHFSPDPARKYVVADMITGYGVAESVIHYYKMRGESVLGKKVVVQGWGNVAAAAAYYLAQQGVLLTGVIDREGGLINPAGYTYEEVKSLFLSKQGNKLNAFNSLNFEDVNAKIWDQPADIFIPAAASRLVTREQMERLIDAGLEVVSSGANVPFADKEIFFGPIAQFVDERIAVIPDFIANCGMARVFAYLMEKDVEISDDAIFGDVSKIIGNAMARVHHLNPGKTNITRTAFEIALKELL